MYYNEPKTTKREILFSIIIISVLLIIGFFISGNIRDNLNKKYQEYNTAIEIENDSDLFQYGMKTDIGNAFVYGDLIAVDTVTYPEIGGAYMYVEKIKEKYTKHTRQVAHTRTVNGKSQTYYTTETYWTWDEVDSENLICKQISFCGITFSSNKFNIPSTNYIDTLKESSHVRYKYYGTKTKYTGTIYTKLENNTITDKTKLYNNLTIEETKDNLKSGLQLILFWVFWIILIIICIIGFYYIDNRWLEDKR